MSPRRAAGSHRDDDPTTGAGFDEYRAWRGLTGQFSAAPIVGNLHPHPADHRGRGSTGIRTRKRHGRRHPKTRTGDATNQGHRAHATMLEALDDRAPTGAMAGAHRSGAAAPRRQQRAERNRSPRRPYASQRQRAPLARRRRPGRRFAPLSPTRRSLCRRHPGAPDAASAAAPPTRCTSHLRPSVATTSSAATPASAWLRAMASGRFHCCCATWMTSAARPGDKLAAPGDASTHPGLPDDVALIAVATHQQHVGRQVAQSADHRIEQRARHPPERRARIRWKPMSRALDNRSTNTSSGLPLLVATMS